MPRDYKVNDTLAMLPGGRASVPPWNKSEVMERLGEDEDLLREMCGIFLSESANLLQKLRHAVSDGQAEAVMRAAHSLKGSVGDMAAPEAEGRSKLLGGAGGNRSRAPLGRHGP